MKKLEKLKIKGNISKIISDETLESIQLKIVANGY